MTSTKIRAKAYELVEKIEEMEGVISFENRIALTQALATLEVAAQLAELNERLATSLTSGPEKLPALRIFKTS